MHSEKCPQCGLVNLVSDFECRRCGRGLMTADRLKPKSGPREAARRPTSFLWTLLLIAALGGAGYYLIKGVETSIDKVKMTPGTPVAHANEPQTRAAVETKAKQSYGNAIKDSPGLRASQSHVDDVNKLMHDPPAR